LEDKICGGCDSLPEIEASLTPFVSRAIWSGPGIFKNAALTNQVVEIFGAVRLNASLKRLRISSVTSLLVFISLTSLSLGAAVCSERVDAFGRNRWRTTGFRYSLAM